MQLNYSMALYYVNAFHVMSIESLSVKKAQPCKIESNLE